MVLATSPSKGRTIKVSVRYTGVWENAEGKDDNLYLCVGFSVDLHSRGPCFRVVAQAGYKDDSQRDSKLVSAVIKGLIESPYAVERLEVERNAICIYAGPDARPDEIMELIVCAAQDANIRATYTP